ncbi:N-acetylmuramoyl-L-alanine amidase [Timonella senegalensis]|uniref:N-acetylmuramoyl-L-alanine amidase n=1 Tax=Timonella senegalensis TaxID=1465825 RepID=UPI0002FCA2BF|nr:N-acetylmuramoyl-L-alanine amidase [Timonella senegalensis]
MATYFQKHPQTVRQWGEKRRNGGTPTGTCVVHTAENATDFIGPDAGAESVAKYFTNSGRQASYHFLADSDSRVQLVPWASEAWHDTRTNNWSVGGSVAIQCKDWKKLGDRGRAAVRQLAEGFAQFAEWLYKTKKILIPAKHITRAQALARKPGFIGHGEMDPGRRSDPGKDFDWKYFLAEFKKRRDKRINPPAPAKPVAKPGWYHVTGVPNGDRLVGRTGPSTKHKIKTRRANGFNIYLAKIVKVGSTSWGVTNYGTHYSMHYLSKGKK